MTAAFAAAFFLTLSYANAGEILFDFEDSKDFDPWKVRSAQQDRLIQSNQFATHGGSSALFTSPQWRTGMEEWPAFEAPPRIQDWRGYDRLMVDIVNPDKERHEFSLLISDGKTPFRQGLSYRFSLPSRGFQRYEVPLSNFPENVDRSDIQIIHFYGQRPEADMALHLDQIALLRPGEKPPEPESRLAADIARLVLKDPNLKNEILSACQSSLDKALEAVRKRGEAELQSVSARLEQLLKPSTLPSLSELAKIQEEIQRIPGQFERDLAVLALELEFNRKVSKRSPFLVGFATSMEKILPYDRPFQLQVSDSISVSLARAEKEGFQVCVLPRENDLKKVQVQVSDLRSKSGDIFPAKNVDCDVVGYVRTANQPPYEVPYVGWWPDPILGDFVGPVDIAKGCVQAFWIRVRAARDQAPGNYEGALSVTGEGADPLEFRLKVHVYPFALPEETPLPTAITFFEHKDQMGGPANWAAMKLAYADFLADYYIDYDSLYRSGPPDFEILQHLHEQNRLVAFNLGNVLNGGSDEAGFEKAIQSTVDEIRPGYEKAKELGILDHAYIYGFDERPKEQFSLLERSAQALKKAFPEPLLLTTSYDDTYGMGSEVKSIDAWCPLTPKFDPNKAKTAREAGKKVWWYICCGPHHPFANWFVEYPAIEARLLMGAMAIRQRPDGFLYYSLTIWNDNLPIETGPFTTWNPVSWTTYHGDGSLLCAGPGGRPLPTIRLENYRDGMEDYAYACILERIVKEVSSEANASRPEQSWLSEAGKALEVPESLIRAMDDFSRDPKELYAYRDRLGQLIEESDRPAADPWGQDFGVRGFQR